jgi:hypothetical protein
MVFLTTTCGCAGEVGVGDGVVDGVVGVGVLDITSLFAKKCEINHKNWNHNKHSKNINIFTLFTKVMDPIHKWKTSHQGD